MKTIAAMLFALALAGCALISPPPAFKPMLDHELAALVTEPQAPLANISALAIRAGRVVYQGQVGRRVIDEAQPANARAVDERTLFRMASISKLVVAVGVLRLLEMGRVDLDEDVSLKLGWRLRNPHFPEHAITLRQLLSHRSSLQDGEPARYNFGAEVALADVLARGEEPGGHWQKQHAPGGWFHYANLNLGVIASVMERAGGERFERLMQRLVLQPLGLRGGFEPSSFTPADLADLAPLYRKRVEVGGREIWASAGPWHVQMDDVGGTPPVGLEHYVLGRNGTLFGPQGRLRTSVADLGVLMQMLLDEGRHAGAAYLQPHSVRLLASEHWRFDAARPNGDTQAGAILAWGLGGQRFLDVSAGHYGDRLVEGGGFTGWGHFGEAYGLHAAFVLDPVKRQGLVLVATGPSVDPATQPGQWSSMWRLHERALTALYRRALR